MSPQIYGACSSELLPYPQRQAAARYIEELERRYPDLAVEATAGPGNEGIVYVYAPVPDEDGRNIEIHETMAEVAADLLLDTGVSIALMPSPE